MNEDAEDIYKILRMLHEECNSTYFLPPTRIVKRIGENDLIKGESEELQKLLSIHENNVCKIKPKCNHCEIKLFCLYFRKKKHEAIDLNRPTLVDLFSGAGGFSLGFVQEGFRIVLANDIESCCANTYRFNHPELEASKVIQGDISSILCNLTELVGNNSVDIVIGGPPCQGFSKANRQRLIDDPRNVLYKNFVQAVSILRPKIFVMENVRGMLNISQQIIQDFLDLPDHYDVASRVINAYEFGVPQYRERLLFIGNRIGIDSKTILDQIIRDGNRNPKTVLNDALIGLRPLTALKKINSTDLDSDSSGRKIDFLFSPKRSKYIYSINNKKRNKIIYNHKARYNNDRDIEIFSRMLQGDRSDDPKIADIMPYASRNDIFKDKYFKLYEDKPCKTITAHMKHDCNMYIHPREARGLTPREAARVQSYPDEYFFKGPFTKTYMQIGNSVPPLISRSIAKVIKNYLNQ